MNPEAISALEQLLAQAKGGQSAPSPGGDYEAICAKVKADLEPMVTMIGQKLEELQKENEELKDIVFKMVTSFSDAVGSYKQQGLRSSLMEKFGPDIESIGGFYKDAYDSDITEDLLQALAGYDGDPMEMAGESISNLKAKFGKYLGGKPVEAEVTVGTPEDGQGELDLEAPKAEAGEQSSPEEAEPGGEDSPKKDSDKLFEMMGQLKSRKTA